MNQTMISKRLNNNKPVMNQNVFVTFAQYSSYSLKVKPFEYDVK